MPRHPPNVEQVVVNFFAYYSFVYYRFLCYIVSVKPSKEEQHVLRNQILFPFR